MTVSREYWRLVHHSAPLLHRGDWLTTEEEIDYTADKMIFAVKRLRDMSPLYEMVQEGIDLSTVNWTPH